MPRRNRRTFTPEFKARVALEALTGTASQAELCRRHQIGATLLALWKATLLERLPLVFQADEHRCAEAARVDEALERKLALSEPTRFLSLAGRGIDATVDGREVLAGNSSLLRDRYANERTEALSYRPDQINRVLTNLPLRQRQLQILPSTRHEKDSVR